MVNARSENNTIRVSVKNTSNVTKANASSINNSSPVNASNNKAQMYEQIALGHANTAKQYAEQAEQSANNAQSYAESVIETKDELLNNEDFKTVVTNIDNINTVGENIENVITIAEDLEQVADNLNVINNVNDNLDAITSVNTNIQDINTVASNIEDIQNAEENATIAKEKAQESADYSELSKKWAISDELVENIDYSSKHYAEVSKAQAEISTNKTNEVVESANNALENIEANSTNAITEITELFDSSKQEISSLTTSTLSSITSLSNNTKNEISTLKTDSLEEITNTKNIAISDIETLTDNSKTEIETLGNEKIELATVQTEIAITKASEASQSASNALKSAENSALSEASAKESENNAKTSETNAKISEQNAKTSEQKCQEIYDRLGVVIKLKGRVDSFEDLPTTDVVNGDAYLVGVAGLESYPEYYWYEDHWEYMGSTEAKLEWGGLTGTLSNQTDLQTALDSKISDVQANGTSIVSNGVANIPVASSTTYGLVKPVNANGIYANSSGTLNLYKVSDETLKSKKTTCAVLVNQIDLAVKTGITTNTITLTDEEKANAKEWLGFATSEDIPDISNLATKDEIPSIDGLVQYVDYWEFVEDINNKVNDKQDTLTAGENITIEDGVISASGGGHDLFDIVQKDHILTYEETQGFELLGNYVYKEAIAGSRYGYPDFYAKCIEEKEASTATDVTLGENIITMYINANGHQFFDIADKDIIDAFYNSTGTAWFYGIDTTNERVLLPRNDYYFKNGGAENVGEFVEAGLPELELTNESDVTVQTAGAISAKTGSVQIAGNKIGSGGSTTGYANTSVVGFNLDQNTSMNTSSSTPSEITSKNSIYGNSETVQPPSVSVLAYMVVGNTSVESAVTDVIDVTTSENDTIPLFHNFWSKEDMTTTGCYVNASLGSWLSGNVYTTAYNTLVAKVGTGNVKSVSDTYTDYDFVVNADDMTFRLPLKNGQEVMFATGVKGNGYTIGVTNGTENVAMGTDSNNVLKLWAEQYGTVPVSTAISGTASKGTIGLTTDSTKSGIVLDTENITIPEGWNLYYKVANAVQNLEILDVAGVTADLNRKVNINSDVIDGQWIAKTAILTEAVTAGVTAMDLSDYLPKDNYQYEVLLICAWGDNQTNDVAVYSDIIPRGTMQLDLSANGYFNGSYITMPIGTGRVLYQDLAAAAIAEAGRGIEALAYRRIGTNQ